ncbi:TPA: bifunctional transcriptional activator/DNA repair enzyme AdaA [Burkholderia cepacia]|uniref:bifunctional transcriptional activator/DNA repair enzyme AdaA n=1 Tax=Burkholderia cepacia TaxID=292 RepID=UPI001C93356F|nr:methylated-DNA--[protein]-cysteine S-methyltransferase [Burkholderia cepacia]HDR9763326.1 methylated-DNA--[protein]-cysteine S-methyltransferase [Burkholderia cepacia ATCC 25416]MBY4708733.1 methylated-DNA--[protein]-cysteine S-methyltransferase [Burkholderia cepacia]MBY4735756.1 methylated-DNA--[protein]-cysteine S-methyltransferase [Burkholderia cepacia]MBY4742758.1 methylated-DNA--[protein]-cysteine S-methyltransferase [Burkholderia cepacia]MBY4756915.1 methylated-DNA--[protein]-cysteine
MQVTDTRQIDTYYRALVERAADHVGIFYVGVKTTGVFCIATCRARKPKRENVVFYTELKETLNAGFRPCKVCKPTENANTAPPEVAEAIDWVRTHPKERLSDYLLRQRGLSPERIRRWFQQHYGMSFQAFQRSLRINLALEELKAGRSTTDVALDSGYDSLSGFGYTCRKLTGRAPTEATNVILIHRFTTPLGPMFVCASEQGVCLLEFVDRRMLETEFKDLQRLLRARILAGENAHTRQTEREIGEYFAGTRKQFDLTLDTPGSPFRKSVWQALQAVPYGSTASYGEQAEKLGKPLAVRAVAGANGANRVSIVIPCHRVLGKDGTLTGYGGGLARKQWLLDHEKRHA